MEETDQFCPAKVNLFLAVTGRREDGFHELVSVMAAIDLGDHLRIAHTPGEGVSFRCSDPRLPQDGNNLVLRAVAAFRQRHPFSGRLEISLEKRIPAGAGLGGGSSDAAGCLLALNRLLGKPLTAEDLHTLAASIGSDCPFFLNPQAAVVRGRGERIEYLPEEVRERIAGVPVLLAKPSFPVSTAWAYGALTRMPAVYSAPERAEARLKEWVSGREPLKELLFNNLEPPVFRKFVALPVLKRRFVERLGLPALMSGSGSTLFALLENERMSERAEAEARDALGEAGWVATAKLL